MADLADLAERLQAIADELAEAGIDVLREAVRSGASKRPAEERRISQARRAVDRAVAALRAAEAAADGTPDNADDTDEA